MPGVAKELSRTPTLAGWLRWTEGEAIYGRRHPTYGIHLQTELHFRTFPLRYYSALPLTGHQGVYWEPTGDGPPCLRDYVTGQSVQEPEQKRGEPLSHYLSTFRRIFPGKRLVAVLSFGDAGVNQNRGLLMREELLWIPRHMSELSEPRPWMVQWKTGFISVDRLSVEDEVRNGKTRPVAVRQWPDTGKDVLPDLHWAITGLPVIIAGKPDEEVVYRLDDDLRHLFPMPPKDGCYLLEKALLEARAQGWRPTEPLEIDLSVYGELTTTIGALLRAGYRQAYSIPPQAGEFQLIARDRVLCRPRVAGYGVNIVGLTHDDSLGSFIAKAPLTNGGHYFGPSVIEQIRMVAPFFTHAFILDEGQDRTFYDLSCSPEEFPVRGRANRRLSAAICVYEM